MYMNLVFFFVSNYVHKPTIHFVRYTMFIDMSIRFKSKTPTFMSNQFLTNQKCQCMLLETIPIAI